MLRALTRIAARSPRSQRIFAPTTAAECFTSCATAPVKPCSSPKSISHLHQQIQHASTSKSWALSGDAAEDISPQPLTYKVEIFTGDVRGAGTHAPAAIQLIGSEGESAEFMLGDEGEEYGFDRGSRRSYELEVGDALGTLRSVFVQQVSQTQTELGNDWYLERVEVTGPEGVCWVFACEDWFGRTEDDESVGLTQRTIQARKATIQAAPLEKPLKMSASAVAYPHPEKVGAGHAKAFVRKYDGWAGEDAYFCTTTEAGGLGVGVADGVYMWKQQGIDSGLFSRSLMRYAKQALKDGVTNPVKVLRSAEDGNERDDLKGSCTACIAIIDPNEGQLRSANVGDSGYMLLTRAPSGARYELRYHTPQQEHSFGCPYQLGHYEGADAPEDAMLMTLPVRPGDVLIVGSDGLWDNLSTKQILEEARQSIIEKKDSPASLALKLSTAAFHHSVDRSGQTPYSQGASEAFDMVYSGGKMDDITVCCVLIT